MTQQTQIEALQDKLNSSLKDIYVLALRADEQIEELKQEDKGKFSAIFKDDSGFEARADHFLPYLMELSEDVQALKSFDEHLLPNRLQMIVKKIKLMTTVLNQFHAIN